MQPATVEAGAPEAALLSQEQLQYLSSAARVFWKGVEEVTRVVTRYLAQLKDIMPAARDEATHKAVQ
jgi:hypothetical protein